MTYEDLDRMRARLRERSGEELQAFVGSLLLDEATGVGVYARAFAAGDVREAVSVIEGSIRGWRGVFRHHTYHQADGCAAWLGWTLEAIETVVLPEDPREAFRLVVLFFENDEDVGTDDLNRISRQFERAGELFEKSGGRVGTGDVEEARARLLRNDRTGYRACLERRRVDAQGVTAASPTGG